VVVRNTEFRARRFGLGAFPARLRTSLLAVALAGCPGSGEERDGGSNDGGDARDSAPAVCGPGMDGPPPDNCPPDALDRADLCGACCWRESNADRLDQPELRMSAIRITTPTSLSNVVVRGLLTAGVDEERFNWIMRLTVDGPTVMVEHGYGERNDADATFSFVSGIAPGPGDANRWDRRSVAGTLTDETLVTETTPGLTVIPTFDVDRTSMSVELPLRELTIDRMVLSHDRTCVGERRTSSYGTDDGDLTTYITRADATGRPVKASGALDTTLCMFMSGRPAEEGTCDDLPQEDWPVPLDSLCDDTGCVFGGCAPATCNAWQVNAELAFHGVEIVD